MSDETLAENIANHLRREILRGNLAPGSQVKERDNAAEMGVSRTPMREAIRILAKEGLVTLRPARSPIVAQPTFREVADNIEVLTSLELLSAKLAVERATDAQIDEIAEVAGRMARDYDTLDMIDVFELDMEFHRAIARASNNPVLAEAHRAILARLWRARYLSATRKRSRDRVLRQHDEIVQSLRARDPKAAQSTLYAHLEALLDNVTEYFKLEGEELPPETPERVEPPAK
ncbi:GntR family transcriptional regulator [Tropicibacter naphthalenivorans]|uniref:Putative HTH-type transcriptional regulator YdfH n=1 Tax=Tropicibacter naphthalenivorans TaxID=441103 RepID=A0A0P1G2U7_9RHOB|nr:GntR family transcriptional regulator [Tropicibacter naphthalenivorans]CUH76014.1 putative HTH-type transcriptional regulator YdfH [Tropicibacter naphthalenivorans]SMC40535.1 transcriptional regulator, GntR family [Tropicibacter naphthalenivorans]